MLKTLFYRIVPLYLCSGTFVFAQTMIPSWEVYNESNSLLPNNTIRCLLVDHQNDLWVGTDNGLAHLSNGTWEIFNTSNSGIGDNYIRALAVDSMNAIWIGTTINGVLKYDGVSFQSFTAANSDLPDNFIKTITIDKVGHKWIGTVEGLSKFDGTNWVTWTSSNSAFTTNNIASIGVGLDNEKYIGTINGGLVYMDNASNIIANYYVLNSGVPDNSALKVEVDNIGRPWYASSAGGLFTDPGNQAWVSFNSSNSLLLTNSLTTMKMDGLNNIYMGTQLLGLMIRRANVTWAFYSTDNSDLPEDHILSITKDADENVWIGTYSKGLVKLRETPLEVDEVDAFTTLQVYPNPAQSNDAIFFNQSIKNAQLTIYSMDAKMVLDEFITESINTLQLPELKAGYYFLTIQRDNSSQRLELMVRD